MTPETPGGAAEIQRGRIYQDVYHKRVDRSKPDNTADLERAAIIEGKLEFPSADAAQRAFTEGIFLLDIPEGIDCTAGDEFSRQFYQGPVSPRYGHFRDITHEQLGDPLLGFHRRVDQIEQFLLERRFWQDIYPPEITALGESLTRLSQQILQSVLTRVGIPPEQWSRATGCCSEASGSYHMTFNHYRPVGERVGLSSHKDDGFLTILRTTAPGLEINRNARWETAPVDPSCFTVNFGLSTEILTERSPTPIAAILHRVTRQDSDRTSYGHFSSSRCLPGDDEGVYRYLPGVGLDRLCGARELIEENDHEIYEGTDDPEGTPHHV